MTFDGVSPMAELRKANVEYKVYKNSIIGRACAEAGYPEVAGQLSGMSAIAFSLPSAL